MNLSKHGWVVMSISVHLIRGRRIRNESHENVDVTGRFDGALDLGRSSSRGTTGFGRGTDFRGAYEFRRVLVVRQNRAAHARGAGTNRKRSTGSFQDGSR